MQSRFTVLDDTRRHPDLAARITDILTMVASPIEEITGLTLPPTVRYRLTTPKAWRRETIDAKVRTLIQDTADLALTPEQTKPVALGLKLARIVPVLVWPLVNGATATAADGEQETRIAPRALHHGGLLADEPVLVQMIAHELVHHVQAAHNDTTAWQTLFPEHRAMPHPRITSMFLEGHARWTDQQITQHLYGAPVDDGQAPRSLRYRLHKHIPGIRHLGPSRAAYEEGARFFAYVAAHAGLDQINRVWKDTALLPTKDEFAHPQSWLDRTAP
ncbi:zinc-dependent metalloprotease [Streptomyces sp. NPDC001508]|uniref:zinc-dependent metalloprotease n=1 Tax=Streptomyces sp. NPDC001508 TaxID=3154656 RepID=UPI003330721C